MDSLFRATAHPLLLVPFLHLLEHLLIQIVEMMLRYGDISRRVFIYILVSYICKQYYFKIIYDAIIPHNLKEKHCTFEFFAMLHCFLQYFFETNNLFPFIATPPLMLPSCSQGYYEEYVDGNYRYIIVSGAPSHAAEYDQDHANPNVRC